MREVLWPNLGQIYDALFSHLLWQTKSQTKEASIVMPFEVWNCLMAPLVPCQDGADWDTNLFHETLTVEQNGLSQLDYLFGQEVANCYNWKQRTFGTWLSQCRIERIVIHYDVKNLTIEARHQLN